MNYIDIKWDFLGAKLATLSADKQALFFKGFAKELANYDTHYARETQMLYVNDKMSDDVKKTLKEYLPSLWYEE